MALIECPECGAGGVSDSATKCPKCGAQLRKPRRSVFGQIMKWIFLAFNVLMLIWLITGVSAATKGMDAMSETEQAGTAVGTGIGAVLIVILWALGAVILGLLVIVTRPKS